MSPVLRGIAQLLNEWLDVALVVKVVGVDGSVTDEVGCSGDIAACWGSRVDGRIMGSEIGGDASEMMEGVELVGCCGSRESGKEGEGLHGGCPAASRWDGE